jgi:peptidoglycan/LPS O-acetylase OafA/YrhL/Flp pilus assembly protein TadD
MNRSRCVTVRVTCYSGRAMDVAGQPPSSRLGYRPALDGFRAIAILLVILYHDRRLVGGFLGVDMFFVLSGLLITSILLEEWDATGSIRLGRFYARRFLRLGPALVAFVAVVYFVTHFLQPAFADTLRDHWAAAALLYVTNLLIAYGREYPLGAVSIHWSLAIEEQFYLLWPLGLRFLLRRGLSRTAIGGLLLGASLFPALIRAVLRARGGDDPSLWLRVYFAPDTRADTLLLGCALAVLGASVVTRPRLAGGLAAACGAGALGYLAATHHIADLTRRPYLFTLTACASAAVLRAVWANGAWARVLELPPLPWLGRLSYSLYLWHLVGLQLAAGTGIVGKIGVVLALACASYYLVERPFLAIKSRLSATATPAAPSRLQAFWLQPVAGLLVMVVAVGFGYRRLVVQAAAIRLAEARDRVSQSPQDPQRLAELGEALLQAGDPAGTVSAFEAAVRLEPRDAAFRAGLGLALRRAGRSPEARARLDEALRLDPRQGRAYFGLGELALDGDRLDEAIQAYERSLEIQPDYAAAHTGAGIAYALRGELERAIPHFSEAVRLHPDAAAIANLERAQADLRRRSSGAPPKSPSP